MGIIIGKYDKWDWVRRTFVYLSVISDRELWIIRAIYNSAITISLLNVLRKLRSEKREPRLKFEDFTYVYRLNPRTERMALGVISRGQLSVPERKEKKPVLDKYVFELPVFIK